VLFHHSVVTSLDKSAPSATKHVQSTLQSTTVSSIVHVLINAAWIGWNTCNGVRERHQLREQCRIFTKDLHKLASFPFVFIHIVSDYRYSRYSWVSVGYGSCSIEYSLNARLWLVENRHHSHFPCIKRRNHFVRMIQAKQYHTITAVSYLIIDWQLWL